MTFFFLHIVFIDAEILLLPVIKQRVIWLSNEFVAVAGGFSKVGLQLPSDKIRIYCTLMLLWMPFFFSLCFCFQRDASTFVQTTSIYDQNFSVMGLSQNLACNAFDVMVLCCKSTISFQFILLCLYWVNLYLFFLTSEDHTDIYMIGVTYL